MSLFVGRLRTGLSAAALRAHFEQFGALLRFEHRGPYAFVTYETDDQAMNCMDSGRNFGGVRLKIEWAKESKNYEGSARRPAIEGCFICQQLGHFARECPNRFLEATFNSVLIEGYTSYSDRFRDEPSSIRGPSEPRGGRDYDRPPRGSSDRGSSRGRHGRGPPPPYSPSPPPSPPPHRYRDYPSGGSPPPPPGQGGYREHGDYSRDYDPYSRDRRRPSSRDGDYPDRPSPDRRDHRDDYYRDRAPYDRASPPRSDRAPYDRASPPRSDRAPYDRASPPRSDRDRHDAYDRDRASPPRSDRDRHDAYSRSPRGGRSAPRYEDYGRGRAPSPPTLDGKRSRAADSPSPVRDYDDKKRRSD